MIVGDLSQLQNLVTQQVINTIQEEAESRLDDIILECFKEHMDADFYAKYSPRLYERSFQMREKIGIRMTPIISGDNISFGVEFDHNLLHRDITNNMTQRYIINGEDMREEIMESIINGTFDAEFNKKNPNPRTEDIIEKVMEDEKMMSDIVNDLKSRLIAEGFEVIG